MSESQDNFPLVVIVLVIVFVAAVLLIFMLLPAFRGGEDQGFGEELPRGLDLDESGIESVDEPLDTPFEPNRED